MVQNHDLFQAVSLYFLSESNKSWDFFRRKIDFSFVSDTFPLINMNISFFIRSNECFARETAFVTFYTQKEKKNGEKKSGATVTFSKQIKKNIDQTNWWILQCITTNWRISVGLCDAFLQNLSFFLPFLGLKYRVPIFGVAIFIHQDLTWILMTQRRKRITNIRISRFFDLAQKKS